MENEKFLTEQIITYLGNKRKLLPDILSEVENVLKELGKEKGTICDLFAGSGIVARGLKKYSDRLFANDLEKYCDIINKCYLTDKDEFNLDYYNKCLERINNFPTVENGIISSNYAPKNDNDIKEGERVFYTHKNAVIIDTIRTALDECNIANKYKPFFLAPLLYEASVHNNTAGVFKGFYKSKTSNVGKFGGEGENALERILGKIELKLPVFSNYSCCFESLADDANEVAKYLKNIDITYIDPPYNQHPYGSNYFMLNTIVDNKITGNLSKVAGIPDNWNKSSYNKKNEALKSFEELIYNIDSKYIIISYNNEGFITIEEMTKMLNKYGELKIKPIEYVAYRASRNLDKRDIHTTEYIFVLEKKNKLIIETTYI